VPEPTHDATTSGEMPYTSGLNLQLEFIERFTESLEKKICALRKTPRISSSMILSRFTTRFRSQRSKLIVGGMAAALVFGYAAGRRGSDISWVFRLLQGKSVGDDDRDAGDSATAQSAESSEENDEKADNASSRRWWSLW